MNRPTQITFSPFCLDLANEQLWRGTETLDLRPKAFRVLSYLLRRPGQLLTKDALLDACWPETAVTDTVLKVCIREIRDVLGDDPQAPRFIETAHRRGYRFIGRIEWQEELRRGETAETKKGENQRAALSPYPLPGSPFLPFAASPGRVFSLSFFIPCRAQ